MNHTLLTVYLFVSAVGLALLCFVMSRHGFVNLLVKLTAFMFAVLGAALAFKSIGLV